MSDTPISERLYLKLLGSPNQSLGGNEVSGFRSAKTQALLYYLAETGETQPRATLATLFWPDASQAKASNGLRAALSSLRKLIPDQLRVDRQSVSLHANRVWLDTQQFTLLLQKTDDPTLAMQQRQAAVSLYAGDFLDGFHVDGAPDFEHWVTTTREYFQQVVIKALMDLAREYASRRDSTASLAALARVLTMAPGNESAHRLTMQVLANTGQRAAAILQFDVCRRYLAEELGVDPEPETMALYTQLLEGPLVDEAPGEPAVSVPGATHLSVSGPGRDLHLDRGDMPGRTSFHGRTQQLAELTNRLLSGRGALVVLSGIGGVGKTAFAAELIHRLAGSPGSQAGFGRIIWRSLINAPSLSHVLDDWLQALVQAPAERLPEALDGKLALLFAELDRQRVLLVLDNVESIMAVGDHAGEFRSDYEPYRHLLARMAHGHHQSSLLITTRVVPRGIGRLATDYPHVYHLSLAGLSLEEGTALLRERAVKGNPAALQALVDHYSGNPLALKLIASTVNDLYAGDPEAFLSDGALVFDDIRGVLDQQFDRLSGLARDLLIWLAINREPIGFDELRNDLAVRPSRREFLEAIRLLRRSSLLQGVTPNNGVSDGEYVAGTRLALHNVVMEYLSDRLLKELQSELKAHSVDYFHRYALCKASAPEYVLDVQKRLFLVPLTQWLMRLGGAAEARGRLRGLLDHARQDAVLAKGYTGANVIHLMLQLSSDLQGENFSGLSLRQADLRSASLVDVDLRNTELGSTRFVDRFGIVSSVAVSPDGQFLAAGADQTVVVWRLQTRRPYLFFEGHPRTIADIAFAPDSRHLVSAGYDGTLFLWDVPAGELVHRRRSHAGDVLSIAFDRDGDVLVSGGYNGRIEVWDWRRDEVLGTLAPEQRILRLAFAPTGELLAIVGYYGEIQAWDVKTQKIVYTLHNESFIDVTHAALAPGHSLIWAHQGDAINGWDLGNRVLSFSLGGHKVWIDSLALSPDENQIASADAYGTITLWDVGTRQSLRFLEGHQGSVRTLTYTPDGRYLISGGYDETVRIWNPKRGLEETRLQGHFHWIYKLAFSPNGQYLAGVTLTGAVYLWRGHDLGLLHIRQGHKSASRALAFSPDSQLLATGGDDGCVTIWDVQSGEQRHALPDHEGYVRTVAFDHTGHYLASNGYDSTIRLWATDSGRLLNTISLASPRTMDRMAVHPDHGLLAYGDTPNYLYLWAIETGQIVASVALASQPHILAFSPDGRHLACGLSNGSVVLWELVADASDIGLVECWRVQPSTQCVWRLSFSLDGSLLAWNGEQMDIYVATVTGGEVLYSVPGTHLANCIAFSADGQHLLTDGAGFNMFVYDALTGEADQPLTGHTSNLTYIVTSPASATIASSDNDGAVKLWDVASGTVLATTQLNGPYLGMNIMGATGLTQGQRQALLALGAVDEPATPESGLA